MAKTPTQRTTPRSRAPMNREAITLEHVTARAPSAGQAEKISARFALDPVDHPAIREATEEMVGRAARSLVPNVNETAMRIHLQRIVGAFVLSADRAATFYGDKVTAARDLGSTLANDHRDEDRDAIYGFESKLARAQDFAAQAGLASFALLAAAEGAVHAYAAITGDEWKPYVASTNVSREANAARMEAFD